jgi:hypothetical protein
VDRAAAERGGASRVRSPFSAHQRPHAVLLRSGHHQPIERRRRPFAQTVYRPGVGESGVGAPGGFPLANLASVY